ncbi:MAG: NADH-quinone oxidoreductase subunit N [Candidatus Kapabacteria bacterium]|nr:NADH-quinone oxidoreductase subunit N [Candidatus Kapabacteria bacterium]
MHIDLFGSLPLIVIWLALGAVGIAIQAFVRNNTRLIFGYYAGTLVLTAALALLTSAHKGVTFEGMISLGGFASYFDVLFCFIGLLSMFAARPYLQRENAELDEYYTMLVSAISGMMLMAHANNLLVLFIGIELMSISFYIMAGFLRTNIRSVEAALKYFLLGAFATGFLVYGMALIYGATGSLQYEMILSVVGANASPFPTLLAIGAVFLAVALSFKIAAFPFHQWAPDVYEGSPTVVTAFMSTAGKAAAFSAFIALFAVLMPTSSLMTPKLQLMLAAVSAITMLVGNITAVAQSNVKRMLAYSSVAHAGYLLMGIVAHGTAGYSAIAFYVTSYTFMQLGAFVVVGILERGNEQYLQISDYAGLAKREPVLAFVMAVFMFSLAGIPPFAGFFGKYLLFVAAIEAGYTWLTIVAVVSSVVSAYFYLGLIVKMYFTDSETEHARVSPGLAGVTLAVTTVVSIIMGLFTSQILSIFSSWW